MGAALAITEQAKSTNAVVSKAARSTLASAARTELAKRHLYWFLRESWGELEPGAEFKDNWHVKAFCDHVQWILEGWLVALGKGDEQMRARVIAGWERHGMDGQRGLKHGKKHGELLVQNMVWNLPPGTLKSRILMVCAPAWMWLHDPTWSVFAISGTEDNVKRDSIAHRELTQSAWYRTTFKVTWTISRRQDSVGNWKNTAGGERKSRSFFSTATGIHCNAIFLDDPDDADRVWNESARKNVQNRWTRALRNRGKISADLTIRIAIQQRVHVDDWTAAQVAKGIWSPNDRRAWAWIVVPVFYGAAPDNAPKFSPWGWCDPRTAANDNLQPAIFSDEALADEERDRGPEGFAAQYNQNPDRFDGGLIPRSNIHYFRVEGMPALTEAERPRPQGTGVTEGKLEEPIVIKYRPDGRLDIDWLDVTVDCSNGSEQLTASAVGILIVGGKGMQRFVFDDTTAIMDIDKMYDAIAAAIAKWPVTKAIIELKAAGASVIANLKKRLAKGDIKWPDGSKAIVELVAYNPGNDSKESRAAAMVPAFRAGLVFFLEQQQWLYPKLGDNGKTLDQGCIGEICTFPNSKRDDRVDALAQCLAYHDSKPDHLARWRALARA